MLVADARDGLDALTDELDGYQVDEAYTPIAPRAPATDWNAVVDEAYHLDHRPLPAQTEVLGALNETVGPNATIVQAAGSMPGDLQMLWRAEDPEAVPRRVRLLLHGLRDRRRAGDQDGRPEREVYSLVGDGSYLMMAQEIVTAVSENIKLIVVIVQNHGFASIGALSESLGSQRFGTYYRFRDADTGLLDGDTLPDRPGRQRREPRRGRHPGEDDRRVPQGARQARAADPHHRGPHRDRPAGPGAVVAESGGTYRSPRSRSWTARSRPARSTSSTRPSNGRS